MLSHYLAFLVAFTGVFYAYRALQQVVTKRRFRRNGQLVQGTVLQCVRQGDGESSTYWLEVRFTTVAQAVVTAQQTLTSFTLRLEPGQAIRLRYDPKDPQQFWLIAAAMDRDTWIYTALAAACFCAAWFAFQEKP
jgi:hypothetical protein